MRKDFIEAIKKYQAEFGLNLPDVKIESLADFYEIIQEHNAILHLVAPASTEEFIIRHILESLALLEFLPENARFADIGAGAGLPSLPCLIVREDLKGVLIESKLKKAKFLEEVLAKLELENRATIENKQFEEILKQNVNFVTCRALDKFTKKLPKILKWSKGCTILFFGGHNLGETLEKCGVKFEQKLMPQSEQRFLFIAQI
jgi:16S rRNA (guanine(527)-N(7))-methyltransferase RsmG